MAIAVLAIVSLAVGNLAALVQRSVKRLLAYSSVSHAGFMLIAIAANNELGATALLYYLIPYGAMSIGAFAVVAARERELGVPVTLDNLGGLGWERPFLGASMWVFMLGFMGMPLTGGLIGKLYVFSAAYEAGWWWLIVAGRDRDRDLALLLPRRGPGALHASRRGVAARRRGWLATARPAPREHRLPVRGRHGRLVLLRRTADRPSSRRRGVAPVLAGEQ